MRIDKPDNKQLLGDTIISKADKHLRLKVFSEDEQYDESNEEKYEENYWALTREMQDKFMTISHGGPDWSQTFEILYYYLEQKILEDLNNYNVFDVDHSLTESDHLSVTMNGWTLYFEYDGNEFIKSGYHWANNIEVIAEGSLECSWNTEI